MSCVSVSMQRRRLATSIRRLSHGLLSTMGGPGSPRGPGGHKPRRLSHSAVFSQHDGLDSDPLVPEPGSDAPALISDFLPEFRYQTFPGRDSFQVVCSSLFLSDAVVGVQQWVSVCVLQVLGVIAKGSFGPILKVQDVSKERILAVKVRQL